MDSFDELFDFSGAKIALFCEGKILTSLRDDFPDLPYAGFGTYQEVVVRTMKHLWNVFFEKLVKN